MFIVLSVIFRDLLADGQFSWTDTPLKRYFEGVLEKVTVCREVQRFCKTLARYIPLGTSKYHLKIVDECSEMENDYIAF